MDQVAEPGREGGSATDQIDPGVFAVVRLRYWQHLLNEMLKTSPPSPIPIHLGIGYEAIAIAMDEVMESADRLCLTHRNAAYNLARSGSLNDILRHYRLEATTETGGLMGSMNLAAENTGIAYTSSILGNDLPVATGFAMNRKLRKEPGAVFVLTGDGAMEEGAFWETLLLARTHDLPLVVIVENNDNSMSSSIAERRCPIDLSQVCGGLGIPFTRANGARLDETRAVLARSKAAATNGPYCVEFDVSKFCQHAGPTPGWATDPLRISLEEGLLVEDSPADPLYHIRQEYGEKRFERVIEDVMAEVGT